MYFVTVMTDRHIHWTENNHGESRCVGFFDSFYQAEDAVLLNMFNIHEDVYDYCVVEDIKTPCLYPDVSNDYWYKWIKDHYEPIKRPVEVEYLTNFCLG